MLTQCKLRKLLNNSIWIVPCETLQAYQVVNSTITPVADQTVWKISAYMNGYIFGTSYAAINGVPKSKTSIIGSITPYGDVLLSFYTDNNRTNGQGKFMKIKGENGEESWQFVMQMNTLNTINEETIGLSHWSYMISVTSHDKLYYNLPSVGMSVPEFISKFD